MNATTKSHFDSLFKEVLQNLQKRPRFLEQVRYYTARA